MYIITEETGRIYASSPTPCLVGAVEVETPEGFDEAKQQDWRLEGGALIYDPQPEQDAPSDKERIAALEAANELLTQCLLEMSETLYA